uniref:Pleckstrin homology domain-containing family A member 7 n=1 Tax=Biomphalaria glabrata TaxID=6526 RepID=A0A2C9L698_BIOGL
MANDLLRERLPPGCHLGVTQDGRVFFINDHSRTTSWLHPVSLEPVLTGLSKDPDLPKGWEQDVTNDGTIYYIDHNRQLTTFDHPLLGRPPESFRNAPYTSENEPRSVKAPSSKRNPNSEVVKSGWLLRLDINGTCFTKSWKRRWCVLADFALFIYKGEDESVTLNSVLLPSYRINPCTETDNIKRNFVFKVEHENTKTLYFAAEDPNECNAWMSLLRQAAMMNGNGFQRDSGYMARHMKSFNKPSSLPHTNSGSSYTAYGDPAESPFIAPNDPFGNMRDNSFQKQNIGPNQHGSNRNSLSNSSHGSQNFRPNYNSQSFNPNQSLTSGNSGGPAPGQQNQPLRDGFAPDSARNSLAQSDSSRNGHNSYSPIQAERQRSRDGQGQWVNGVYQQPPKDDSYSDIDTPVKMLHKWDEGFPSMDTDRLKHSSFVELPDNSKGKHPETFNIRSKSHENFLRQPDSRMQVRPGLLTQQQTRASQPQDLRRSMTSGQQQRNEGDGSMNKSSPSTSPPHSHGPSQQTGDPLRGSLRDTRDQRQQFPPGHDRRSYTSSSSSGAPPPGFNSSFRNSGQGQADPRQTSQGSLSRPHQHTDLHLNLKQRPDGSNNSLQSSTRGHTYVNFPNRSASDGQQHLGQAPLPGRPPYPSAVRQQIVEELAETKTPVTQNDFLTSSKMNTQRMQEPAYFQYPTPREKQLSNTLPWEQGTQPNSAASSLSRNQPSSRLSGSSHSSHPSAAEDQGYSPGSPQSRNMMDPEAQKLRLAYERVSSLRLAPDKAPPRRQPPMIHTVKEDPNMSDREVLETNLQKVIKKNPLAGPRLRMSISAGDLIGKTHDELVLFLIQLRRNQATLEKMRDWYKTQLDQRRPLEMEYRRQVNQTGVIKDRRLMDNHQNFLNAKGQMEEIENKLEVYKPIINLLDNMVTMGSLYGGDNLMLATQYRKHLLRPDQYQPPKKMLEFSRKNQEDRLIQNTEAQLKELSSDEVDLEEKIDRLNDLDRLLQEQSFKVSSYKEDKELMERALSDALKQQDQYRNDPREMRRLTEQQRTLEKEISRVTQQLAEASKFLAWKPSPMYLYGSTKEIGLECTEQAFSKKNAFYKKKEESKKKVGSYLETDIDSGQQIDLATVVDVASPDSYKPSINHHRQNAGTQEDWDIEDADQNTKQFYGLVPREKPKGLTVRDVKRQSEQRKERLKKEDDLEGEYFYVLNYSVSTPKVQTVLPKFSHYSQSSFSSPQAQSVFPKFSQYSQSSFSSPKFSQYSQSSFSQYSQSSVSTPKVQSVVPKFSQYSQSSVSTPKVQSVVPKFSQYSQSSVSTPKVQSYVISFYSFHCMLSSLPPPPTPHTTMSPCQIDDVPDIVKSSQTKMDQIDTDMIDREIMDQSQVARILTSLTDKLKSANIYNEFISDFEFQLLSCICLCGQQQDITQTLLRMGDMEEPYKQALTSVIDGDTSVSNITTLLSYLKFVEKHVHRPWRDINDCQEAFKQCLNMHISICMIAVQCGITKRTVVFLFGSVLSMSQQDLSKLPPEDIHSKVEKEKNERAHYMNLHQELARQVTLQTKKQAAARRKTWSGDQIAEIKRQYEESKSLSPD